MATASMLQFIGVLINNHDYMNKTNILGDTLEDVWTIDGLSRTHVKKSMTPVLYGSSAEPNELWDKNKLQYTQKQLNIIQEAVRNGIFSDASKFKEHIINNVVPKNLMHIEIWNDKFYIECNRFKWEATKLVTYPIYVSKTGTVKNVTREVNLVPDVNQFKRFFVTLLIHNLDSQVADYISGTLDWVLPIHDAFITHPNDVDKVKTLYTNKLKELYQIRHQILDTYFNCIGITQKYEEKFEPIIDFEPKHTCLK